MSGLNARHPQEFFDSIDGAAPQDPSNEWPSLRQRFSVPTPSGNSGTSQASATASTVMSAMNATMHDPEASSSSMTEEIKQEAATRSAMADLSFVQPHARNRLELDKEPVDEAAVIAAGGTHSEALKVMHAGISMAPLDAEGPCLARLPLGEEPVHRPCMRSCLGRVSGQSLHAGDNTIAPATDSLALAEEEEGHDDAATHGDAETQDGAQETGVDGTAEATRLADWGGQAAGFEAEAARTDETSLAMCTHDAIVSNEEAVPAVDTLGA
jgi:hypothetical protein